MSTREEELYRIGTVAKLTGISVECLRAWERRYGLDPARRAGNTRFYSRAQLDRLCKIKALIEQGHPIGTLAALSTEQLDARLATRAQIATARLPQVGLVGPNLLLLEQQGEDSDRAEVCHRWVSLEDFATSRATERARLDAVAVQLPSLNRDALERARQAAPDCRLVAVYHFATAQALEEAQRQGAQALQWPVSWAELMGHCAAPAAAAPQPGKAAPRRCSDHELLTLAPRAVQSGQAQDSAQHLVSLITHLNAFGDYATQCVIEDPARADLHERLREEASHARARLERALALMADAQGVPAS